MSRSARKAGRPTAATARPGVLDPDQVLAAARALRELDLLQLLTPVDPQTWDADGVYPSGWSEGDAHAYLLPALQQLRDFLTTAARSGAGGGVGDLLTRQSGPGVHPRPLRVPLTSRRPTWSPSTPTDRLLLDEAAAAIAVHPDGVLTVGDTHGALTLGAIALHGATGVRAHTDLRVAELALAANAERTGTSGFTVLPELDATGARVVLVQAPKALDALREVAEVVAAGADPSVTVLVGGRVKHMTHALNDVLGDSFTDVHATLARQKSRLLVAAGPRPRPSSFPRTAEHPTSA